MGVIEALRVSKSDESIIKRAKELAGQRMTKEEKFEQMISFVKGCGSDLSTEEIKEIFKGEAA